MYLWLTAQLERSYMTFLGIIELGHRIGEDDVSHNIPETLRWPRFWEAEKRQPYTPTTDACHRLQLLPLYKSSVQRKIGGPKDRNLLTVRQKKCLPKDAQASLGDFLMTTHHTGIPAIYRVHHVSATYIYMYVTICNYDKCVWVCLHLSPSHWADVNLPIINSCQTIQATEAWTSSSSVMADAYQTGDFL